MSPQRRRPALATPAAGTITPHEDHDEASAAQVALPGLAPDGRLTTGRCSCGERRYGHYGECLDCGICTHSSGDVYMVTAEVWAAGGLTPAGGLLCVACLEVRLGRPLEPGDLPPLPINSPHRTRRQSQRLRDALGSGVWS